MCYGAESVVAGVVALAAAGASAGVSAANARTQANQQKRAQKQSELQFNSLLAAQPKPDTTVAANSMVRSLSTREAQKILARTGGGTIQTSPLGTQTTPFGKKSLLGE